MMIYIVYIVVLSVFMGLIKMDQLFSPLNCHFDGTDEDDQP
jgi:hypothetical protein